MAFFSSAPTPWIQKVFVVLFLVAVGLVFFTKYHRKIDVLKDVDADPNAANVLNRPKSIPTPSLMRRVFAQIPHPPLATPKAQPTPCEWCRIRAEHYNHAVQTGFATERPNVRTLPQTMPPNYLTMAGQQ